jgi:hypothetical protein
MENPKIIRMGYVIQEFLKKMNLIDAKPKDLMPVLIEKGFFIKDNREGRPLRDILRELDENNTLYFLPQVSADRKDKNVYWYFNAI